MNAKSKPGLNREQVYIVIREFIIFAKTYSKHAREARRRWIEAGPGSWHLDEFIKRRGDRMNYMHAARLLKRNLKFADDLRARQAHIRRIVQKRFPIQHQPNNPSNLTVYAMEEHLA